LTTKRAKKDNKEEEKGKEEVFRRLWSLSCISRGEEFLGLVVNLNMGEGSAQPSLLRVWIITS